MAKKRQKFTYKDVKKPDKFVVVMTRFLDVVKNYGLWVVSGVGAVLFALLMIHFIGKWEESRSEKEIKRYDELYERIASFNSAYADGIEEFMRKGREALTAEDKTRLGEVIAKRKNGISDLLKGVEDFYTSTGDSFTGMLATLYSAALLGESGNFQEAASRISAYLEKNPSTPLRSVLYENLGILYGAMGEVQEAEKSFEKMASGEGTLVRVQAMIHSGDLYNPAFAKKRGGADAEKARGFYEKAIAEFSSDETMLPLSERHFKNLAKERLINLR